MRQDEVASDLAQLAQQGEFDVCCNTNIGNPTQFHYKINYFKFARNPTGHSLGKSTLVNFGTRWIPLINPW
jgi:hypothetical protein